MPIDGSAHSIRAMQEAIKIAKMSGGNITLVNVQPAQPKVAASDSAENIVLAGGQKLVQAQGVPAAILYLEGNIVDQIVKTATEGVFDVIVIGARGLYGFKRVLLGSVSQGVVEKEPCPVIVTK